MTLDFSKEILPGVHWHVLNGSVRNMTCKQRYFFVWGIDKKKTRVAIGNQVKEQKLG